MDIEGYLRKDMNFDEKVENLKLLYKNWFETGCILYNVMSEIVVICSDRSQTTLERVDEIRDRALNAIDKANEIGLTNPDFYSSEKRTNNLAKMIKQAKKRRD